MKDIEALKTVNDQIILSIDEPIYLSAEHYISTLSAQLQLDPNEIKDALDFPYLAAKQRKMAAPVIEKYIAEHPYIEGIPYEEYAKELLHAHPGLHVSMIEDFLKGKNESFASVQEPLHETDKTDKPLEEKKTHVESDTENSEYKVKESWIKLAHLLRICGKVVFWICLIVSILIFVSAILDYLRSTSLYYYGMSYLISLLLVQSISALCLLFGGYICVLLLNAVACLLDKKDPDIPFHHFK